MEWTNLEGRHCAIVSRGSQAGLLQHEYDRLDGIPYPVRMQDMGTLGYVSELGPPSCPRFPFDAEDFIEPEPVPPGEAA